MDELMDLILELLAEDGQIVAEPGRLLSALASELYGEEVRADGRDPRYVMTCAAVRQLELWAFITVVRECEDYPERGNRVSAIGLVE